MRSSDKRGRRSHDNASAPRSPKKQRKCVMFAVKTTTCKRGSTRMVLQLASEYEGPAAEATRKESERAEKRASNRDGVRVISRVFRGSATKDKDARVPMIAVRPDAKCASPRHQRGVKCNAGSRQKSSRQYECAKSSRYVQGTRPDGAA